MLEQSVEENKYIDVLRPKMITQRRNIVQATGVSILTHKKEIFKKSWLMELWASRQTRHPWAQGTEKSFAHKRFFCIGKKRLFSFLNSCLCRLAYPFQLLLTKVLSKYFQKNQYSLSCTQVSLQIIKSYMKHMEKGEKFSKHSVLWTFISTIV